MYMNANQHDSLKLKIIFYPYQDLKSIYAYPYRPDRAKIKKAKYLTPEPKEPACSNQDQ